MLLGETLSGEIIHQAKFSLPFKKFVTFDRQSFAQLCGIIRHYSTIFDIIWRNSILFDAILHFLTADRCWKMSRSTIFSVELCRGRRTMLQSILGGTSTYLPILITTRSMMRSIRHERILVPFAVLFVCGFILTFRWLWIVSMYWIYFIGPAERLFSEEFYKLVHTALKEDGVASFQGRIFNLIILWLFTRRKKFSLQTILQ